MMTFKVKNLKDINPSLNKFVQYMQSLGLCEDDVFYGRLVGCELLTNVVRHCGVEAGFCASLKDGQMVISVSSGSDKRYKLCPDLPDALSESGRGLYIVNCVCNGEVAFSGDKVVAKLTVHFQ